MKIFKVVRKEVIIREWCLPAKTEEEVLKLVESISPLKISYAGRPYIKVEEV